MSGFVPNSAGADLRQEMPGSPTARLDRIHGALASLREEERRLLRLGFEIPLHRCHEQRRYWEFLGGLFAVIDETTATGSRP